MIRMLLRDSWWVCDWSVLKSEMMNPVDICLNEVHVSHYPPWYWLIDDRTGNCVHVCVRACVCVCVCVVKSYISLKLFTIYLIHYVVSDVIRCHLCHCLFVFGLTIQVNIYANQDTLRPVGNPPLAGDQVRLDLIH